MSFSRSLFVSVPVILYDASVTMSYMSPIYVYLLRYVHWDGDYDTN